MSMVRFRETSASELLIRWREQKDDVETGDLHYSRRSPGENLFTVWRRKIGGRHSVIRYWVLA